MGILQAIFGAQNDVTLWQECLRALAVFGYGLFLLRVAGRRIFARWSALDLIVSVVVGSAFSRVLTGNAPIAGTFAATGLLLAVHWGLARLAARYRIISLVLEGRPIVLGEDGRLLKDALAKNAVSPTDLAEALHGQSLDSPAKTRRIHLEPSGRISILKRE